MMYRESTGMQRREIRVTKIRNDTTGEQTDRASDGDTRMNRTRVEGIRMQKKNAVTKNM